MKTTTISRTNIREGMTIMKGSDVFYVTECRHMNDDTSVIMGNYTNYDGYPETTFILFDNDRVKVVLD